MKDLTYRDQRINTVEPTNICINTGSADRSYFDSNCWLASSICQVPIAYISVAENNQRWANTPAGLTVNFSSTVISALDEGKLDQIVEVSDSESYHDMADCPAVLGKIRYAAQINLINVSGAKVGAICIADLRTRHLNDDQKHSLRILAKNITTHLETSNNNTKLNELLEKAQRFHNLFNNSSELHCITDSDGRLAFVNSSIHELLGYTVDEVLGKTIWDFCAPGERERVMPSVYDAIEKGEKRFHLETLVLTKTGDLKWFEWADVIMEGYWLVNGRDITERKFVEQRLKTLSLAVEKSPVGIFIRDSVNRVVWMNEAAELATGFSLADLIGKEFGNLMIGAETDLEALDYAKKSFHDKKPYQVEMVLYKKDRTPSWFYVSNNPLLDNDGAIQNQITILLDINTKKVAEKQLIKGRQEALDLSKSKEVFLSVMSHEMRTPLNAVIGITHLLKEEEHLEHQEDNLKILDFSAQNLLTIINDVLDLTKIETGNLQLEQVPVKLEELISKTVESLKFKTEKGVDVLYEMSDRIPEEILADPTRLYQIFMNLLGNAVKFTHSGHVKLNARLIEKNESLVRIKFCISDTGIGIPQERLSNIFDAYSQAEANTTRKYGGTGLGLTITKNLIELYDSKIHVESTIGKGTTFSFIIAFDLLATGQKEKYEESVAEVPLNAKILVADDNAINRLLAKKVLDRWSIVSEFAENGKEAIEMIQKNSYDMVLMDIHMPVMDGDEAVKILRQSGEERLVNLPVLALTGNAPKDDKDKYLKVGMNDYVLKPFDPHLLYKKIRKYINN